MDESQSQMNGFPTSVPRIGLSMGRTMLLNILNTVFAIELVWALNALPQSLCVPFPS
jgi:hypothetical protein